MSECAREITWAAGTHTFDLNDKRVLLMMQVLGFSPAASFRRFQDEVYSPEDVERIIEFGLIGGGMSRGEARAIIEAHVNGKPLMANALLAANVLAALFVGAADASA